ncbi:cytochrome P450 [Annulohypoxylon moriforme]|nr:cytochrome P450 [Annulohypoxylon moriforme]
MDAIISLDSHDNSTRSDSLAVFPYRQNLQAVSAQGIEVLLSLNTRTFVKAWMNMNWVKWPIIAVLILLFTYFTSTIRFRTTINKNNSRSNNLLREAPIVPYWIPGLFHAFAFLNPAEFLLQLQRRFKSDAPVQLRAGPIRLFFYRNVEDIKAAFRASKRTTNKSTAIFALRNLFDLPKSAAQFYSDDNSGVNRTPRKESDIEPENRINYLITHNVKKYLSSDYLEHMDQRYMTTLLSHLDTFSITDEWIELLDLHSFVQQVAIKPAVETMVGSEFFKLNPNFIDDFLIFQQYVPDFLHLLPSWLMPRAYQVRRRLLQNVKQWHQLAHEHYDCSRLGPEDPNWEPYFGSKLIRARENYSLKAKGMTPDARATQDLSLIFVGTANIVTCMFWYIYEALRDQSLLSRLKEEAAECISSHGADPEIKKLTMQPLLQSTYAEALRLYIAIAVSRVAEYDDINVAGYAIPKGGCLVMYSRSSALDHTAWVKAGRTLNKPLEEFDAERFLVDQDWVRPSLEGFRKPAKMPERDPNSPPPKKRFTVEGLLGLWYPYGGGDRICPGRHYAKHQLLLTFTTLFSKFDLELIDPKASKAAPNMRYAPFGALPPVGKIPFRMRRKVTV